MTDQTKLAIVIGLVVLAGVLLIYATAAKAATIEVPITTVHRGDPGDLFHEGTVPAQPGDQCVAVLESHNNRSVHPDSDILVGPVVFADVEDGVFQAGGITFVASGSVEVFVRLGADGVFSAGFLLEVTCNPTTTTTTTTTTSLAPTTTTPSSATSTTSVPPATTTTLSPPPVGGVDAGGGYDATPAPWWVEALVVLGTFALFVVLLAGTYNYWKRPR
jgi:hypothetical protein